MIRNAHSPNLAIKSVYRAFPLCLTYSQVLNSEGLTYEFPLSNPTSSPSVSCMDRDSFPGGVVDLEDPTHRGRKNHMDRSMLCRRGLVNLISQEHLGSYRDNSVCKATLPTLGNRDLGSLRGVLMLCSKAPA